MKKFLGIAALTAMLSLVFVVFTLSQGSKEEKVEVTTTAAIGKPAPDFKLTSAIGKEHSLSDYKGQWVVLEWINLQCPFVLKHYNSKNMQTLQQTYAKKEVVWLSICSSAPGKQGNFSGDELTAQIKEISSNSTAYLIDGDGKVGRSYGAKTTPQMFIINPEGVLVYAGAIDDKPSTKLEDVKGAANFVVAALDAGLAKKEIKVSSTVSYGCSVKY